MIEPSYRCKRCNGRLSSKAKQCQSNKNNNPDKISCLNQPTLLETLSRELTALACTFVFDANTNIYCIYPAFREARRLKQGIEQTFLMIVFCYLTIFLTYFISEIILGIDCVQYPLMSHYQLLILMFLFLPASSLLCLTRQWNMESLMTRSVLNRRYKDHLPYQLIIMKYTILQAIFAAILINLVRIINLYLIFHINMDDKRTKAFSIFLKIVWTKIEDFGSSSKDVNEVKMILQESEVHFNFFMIMSFITLMQVGKAYHLESVFNGVFT